MSNYFKLNNEILKEQIRRYLHPPKEGQLPRVEAVIGNRSAIVRAFEFDKQCGIPVYKPYPIIISEMF